jgi:hypothetical protein
VILLYITFAGGISGIKQPVAVVCIYIVDNQILSCRSAYGSNYINDTSFK